MKFIIRTKFLRIKHIVWDWNGTLIDDVSLCVNILNELLADYELPEISIEFYRSNFSFPVSEFYKRISLPYNGDEFSRISHSFISKYRQKWTTCSLQPNVIKILDFLNKLGLQQSVLSAGNQIDVNKFVNHFELDGYLSQTLGTDNIKAEGKIQLGHKFFSASSLEAEQILLVGDTLHDLEVGNHIGCRTLLYSKGHNSKLLISNNNANVIDDLMEIVEYLQH